MEAVGEVKAEGGDDHQNEHRFVTHDNESKSNL
jgi:hypothetical protein